MFSRRMLLTILVFLGILFILVVVHEFGHYTTAKRFGVKVEEFGFGFPPHAAMLYQSKDGTRWTLNWLPIGGFVKLKGEEGTLKEELDSFAHLSAWRRVIILSAGVVMNLLLAFILFSLGLAIGWPQDLTDKVVPQKYVKEQSVIIMAVEKDSPAGKAGLKSGDIIKKVQGISFNELEPLQNFIQAQNQHELTIELEGGGNERFIKKVTPGEVVFKLEEEKREKSIKKIGIGVVLGKFGVVKYPVHVAVGLGAKSTIIYTGKIFNAFFNLMKGLIISHKISPDVGGPVMIAALSGKAVRLGFIYILQFLALLSLNLAIINILPLPALDGGRVLFVLVEKFKGQAVSMQIEAVIHLIGFWFLIGLTILITARDFARFEVWEKMKHIFVG
jgi:regulator of sigma E protease